MEAKTIVEKAKEIVVPKKEDLEVDKDAKIEKVETTTKKEPVYVKEGTVKEHTLVAVNKPKEFHKIISTISKLVTEVEFDFSNKGLDVIAMDPANVCMSILSIGKAGFLGMEVPDNKEGSVKYALNLISLKQCLKRSQGGILRMRFKDRMEISMSEKKKDLEYTLPLLAELETKIPSVPQMTYDAEITMETKDFFEAVEDLKVFGESATLKMSKGKFVMTSETDLKFCGNVCKAATIVKKPEQDFSCTYSLEYIDKLVVKDFKTVTIQFKKDHPLRIDYSDDNVKLGFILAPRISSD